MKTTLTGNISDDKLILFRVELKLLIIFRTHGLFMSFESFTHKNVRMKYILLFMQVYNTKKML